MNEDKDILEIFSKLEDEDFESISMRNERIYELEKDRKNREKMARVRSHKKGRR